MSKGKMEMIVAQEPGRWDGEPYAAYVHLPNHPRTTGSVKRTIEAGHGVLLDLDENDKLIGVEILLPLPEGGGVG
jgi:uncharacterized protein YuzE